MHRSLVLDGGLKTVSSPSTVPLLAKGFRPFFLLAAIHAVVIVPLWLAILRGWFAPSAYLEPTIWHAHEMIWGYTSAVVAGFLLTAVGNWTQRETAVGWSLAGLALLWLAGRLAMLLAGTLPRGLPALIDLSFLPAVASSIVQPLVAAKSRRNFAMLVVLAALFVANAIVHLEGLGWLPAGSMRRACMIGIDVVVLLILLVSGRVFPMFTRNATGVQSIRSYPWLDRGCIGAMVLSVAIDVLSPQWHASAIVAGVVGLLAAARAVRWGAHHSLRHPLLWILHAGYAWLVLGLLMRGAGAFGLGVSSLATHALTVGAMGSLTLGMMARVALGHTGRMLVAPRPITVAFMSITLAALARTLVPWFAPDWYSTGLIAAGAFWTLAFAIFLATYAPMLARPRVDGRPG